MAWVLSDGIDNPGAKNEPGSIVRGSVGGSDVGDGAGGSGMRDGVDSSGAKAGVGDFGATDEVGGAMDDSGVGSVTPKRSRVASFSAVVVEVDVVCPL